MIPSRLKICADLINDSYQDYSVLDLGCRTMDLKPLLRGCKSYYGTDISPGEDIYTCNLEMGLPFAEDKSFDIVCALDVLEHLEHVHLAFHEALRVARRAVFVTLPNMYHWSYRLRYLIKGRISDKYDFPAFPIIDRHRWLTSYTESLNFVMANAQDFEVNVIALTPDRGRTRAISEPIERWCSSRWPDIFSSRAIFHVKLNVK